MINIDKYLDLSDEQIDNLLMGFELDTKNDDNCNKSYCKHCKSSNLVIDNIKGHIVCTDCAVVNKEFLLNGFSNKNNIRIESTSIASQRKTLFVPEENYAVRTIKHYTDNEYFYSGLRLIWTGKGWMIYGFVTENPYFSAYTPNPVSLISNFAIGTFTYKDKQSYNKTVVTYPYGYEFTDKQELYDFIKGYGFYLEDRGFIFDQVETDDLKNWQLSAKQFAFWAADPLLPGNYIDLNPAADSIKVNLGFGQLDNLIGTDHSPGLCVTRNNKPLFSKDLVVTRDLVTEIKTKDASNPITLQDLNLISDRSWERKIESSWGFGENTALRKLDDFVNNGFEKIINYLRVISSVLK